MRLRSGEALAAVGGFALLAVMFLGWYGIEGATLSAWEAFSVTDALLLVLALLGMGLALAQVTQRAPALPVGLSVLTVATAMIVGLVLAYRVLNEPGPDDLVEVRLGAWLGLLAVALTGAGAWRSLADEGPVSRDPLAAVAERRAAPPPA